MITVHTVHKIYGIKSLKINNILINYGTKD